MNRIVSTPIEPFGVEVGLDGIDSVEGIMGLTPEEKAELVDLYQADGLLLIRELRPMNLDEQSMLCSIFGPICRPDHPIVSNVRPDGILADFELRFHHDISYTPVPYLGGALHAIEVDEGVSATRFASGYGAYERLPKQLRRRVDKLNAIHLRGRAKGRRTRLTDSLPGDTAAVHPVVWPHQVTGRPYLFVDEDMTGAIIGMPEEDSDALLEELYLYLYADHNVYEHPWSTGDIVIWDNRAVAHARRAVTMPGTRTLQRVNIATLSAFDQVPSDISARDDLLNSRGGDAWSSKSNTDLLNAL